MHEVHALVGHPGQPLRATIRHVPGPHLTHGLLERATCPSDFPFVLVKDADKKGLRLRHGAQDLVQFLPILTEELMEVSSQPEAQGIGANELATIAHHANLEAGIQYLEKATRKLARPS